MISIDAATAGRDIDVDETGRHIGSRLNLYSLDAANTTGATVYLKVYATWAGAEPASTDTPVMTLPIPATSGRVLTFPAGVRFASGLGLRCTTGAADNDTGAPAANACLVNVSYAPVSAV